MRTGVIGGTGFFVFALFVVLSEVVGMGLSEFRYALCKNVYAKSLSLLS